MITIAFPKIQKALDKPEKEWMNDDPRRGVIVIDNHAIVMANQFILVINLMDYFLDEVGIEEDEEIEELERILFFMNEKIIMPDFWEEITKGASMKMKNGSLHIQNPKYSKDLHDKDVEFDLYKALRIIIENSEKKEEIARSASIPFSVVKKINSVLGTKFKNDRLVFSFLGDNEFLKFTVNEKKYIFGYIVDQLPSDPYMFVSEELFTQSQNVLDLYLYLSEKNKVPTFEEVQKLTNQNEEE